ncbi:unnamed protein product, partial [Rotaria sordida]
MNTIEVLKSTRGNPMIYFSGYLYTQHRITEEKRIFRCEDRNCRSRCQTNIETKVFIKEPTEHSHAPDPNRLHIIQLKNELKERSASSDEGTATILFDVLRKVPLNVSANLPTNEALLQTIRRERPAIQIDHNGRLPLILRQTDRGENFIFYEDESMVIFTCDKNLLVLNQCKHWFMDGTFSICPKNYYQLFTVHGMYSSQIIPLVYVLLIGKDT